MDGNATPVQLGVGPGFVGGEALAVAAGRQEPLTSF